MNEREEQAVDSGGESAGPVDARPSLSRQTVLVASISLTVVLTGIAVLDVCVRRGLAFSAIFVGGHGLAVQAGVGIAFSVLVGVVAGVFGLRARFLAPLRHIVREILGHVRPTHFDVWFVALGAGWAEELFFRGVLQEHIGIWWAALVFALMHGVVLSLRWRWLLFGAYLFAAGVGLGYLCAWSGLVAAMVAHAAYDVVAIYFCIDVWKRTRARRLPETAIDRAAE